MSDATSHLASSWESYRILADNSIDVIVEADATTKFTWISPSVTQVLGWRPDELIGLRAADVVHPDDLATLQDAEQVNLIESPRRAGGTAHHAEIRVRTSTGGYRRLKFRAAPVLNPEGGINGHIVTLKDTADRDEALRALSALTEATRVIAMARDEDALLDAMCTTIVRAGGYLLAWYGVPADDERQSVVIRAAAGPALGYLDGLDVSWGVRPEGLGPTGVCLRTGSTQVVSDVYASPSYRPWSERATSYGIGSSVALAVRIHGEIDGALAVYSPDTRAFDADALTLLETVASDLGLGLERVRATRLLQEQAALLAKSEARYRLLAENSSDVVLRAEARQPLAWASDSVRAVLGWRPEDLVGRGTDLIHPEDLGTAREALATLERGMEATGELRVLCADGRPKWVDFRARRVDSPEGPVDVYSLRDIDREVRARKELDFALGHDPLTGMAARPAMVARIAAMLRELRPDEHGAVLCMSVDRLSAINEAFTHAAGDIVLTTIATRLVAAVGSPDRVGRGTGVDFLVVVPHLRAGDDAVPLADALLRAVREPIRVGDGVLHVTSSIGIAVGARADDPERLIRDASSAMGTAKAEGRDRYAFSDPAVVEQTRWRLHVEQRIKEALDRHLLVAHFQPIVDLATREIVGYEALVRGLRDGGRPLAYPTEFMPVAESAGLVCDIDLVMMEAGLTALTRLPPPLTVSVNLSTHTITRPGYLDRIRNLVLESGIRPSRLHLEVTETSLLGESEAITDGMAALAELGARWYVDDFGTGYSSIRHLRDLPISGLKLDVTFSAGVRDGHSRSVRLANALAGLARGLALDTVAEGVETEVEEEVLLSQGWRHGQGYLYGRSEPLA